MKSGIALIQEEREQQATREHFSAEHDSQWESGELRRAAVAYLLANDVPLNITEHQALFWWPWDLFWWKPKDKISNLVRAGALIAAEIDRLQELEKSK